MVRRSRRSVLKRGGTSLTGGLALSLAGCLGSSDEDDSQAGNGDSSDGSGNGDGSANGNGNENGNGDDVPDEPDETVVTVWHAMGGGLGETLDALGEEFTDETGIDVEMVYQGSYEDTLNQSFAAISADTMPEVVQIDSLHAKQILDTGAYQPVSNVLPDDYPFDDFLEPVTDFFAIDGELYSLPFNNSNAILYYNRDVFEEAGLDPDSPPETLEEVTTYSREIVDAGAADYGITWPNHVWFVEHWFALDGQVLVDNENGRADDPTTVHADTETGRAMWEWWRELAQDGLYTNPGMEAWSEAAELFYGQTSAMLLTSTASVSGAIAASEEEGFELGTGYYPSIGDRTGVPIGGASFWVADGLSDRRADEVGRLLEFLTRTENQIEWHRNTGYYPVRQAAVDELESEGWFEESPHHGTAFDQLLESESTPATRRMLVGPARQISVALQEGSVEIFQEQTSVEDGISSMKSQIETEMERYVRARG